MEAMSLPEPVEIEEAPRKHHVCPWWVGYLIMSPLRKLGENPETLLAPLVNPGMTAVDIGCGMGFFSLPLAKMVGDGGRVIGVDVQEKMLSSLRRRARRKGLDHVVETRLTSQEHPGLEDLDGEADLVLAVHVVHETAFPRKFLARCLEVLQPGGKLLFVEPKGHVSDEEFEASQRLAREVGFLDGERIELSKSRCVVLEKKIE